MKKSISFASIFLAAVLTLTWNVTKTVDYSYTPQTEQIELSATDASTYKMDYPLYLRQVTDDSSTITYSNEKTITSDADLPGVANLFFHKEVFASGDPHDAYPSSVNKVDYEWFKTTYGTGSKADVESYNMVVTPNTTYTIWWQGALSERYVDIYECEGTSCDIFKARVSGQASSNSAFYEVTYTTSSSATHMKLVWDEVYIASHSEYTWTEMELRRRMPAVVEGSPSFPSSSSQLEYVTPTAPPGDPTTDYVEYSTDGVTYSRLAATSNSTKQYYSINEVIADGSPISLTELAYSVEKITAEDEQYYMLLTLDNPDAVSIGDISVDGNVILHETDLAKGYIINDTNTEIAIPITSSMTLDGSISNTVDWIEVLDNGTYVTWTIGASNTIQVEMPIEQTANFIDAYIDKDTVSFGENFNLIIDLNNPDGYRLGDLVINGVTYNDSVGYSSNETYTQITLPLTANQVYGDNIYTIESIEFIETVLPYDTYIHSINETVFVSSLLTFTNDVVVQNIEIPGTAYLGDIVDLVITLDNPSDLEITNVNINGTNYSTFQVDATNSIITIEVPVGILEGEFTRTVNYIGFRKIIDGTEYDSNKVVGSTYSYEVLNPIDLANIRVLNFRSEQLKAIMESTFNLILTIDNPNNVSIASVTVDGVTRTDITVSEDNTTITIPVVAMDKEGTQVFDLDGIRFEMFHNIQVYESFIANDVIIEVPVESFAFTKDVNIMSVALADENVYAGDSTMLEIELDNPNGYEITALSINGNTYAASEFDMNEEYTLISIPTTIGTIAELIFNLDSLSIKRFDEVGIRLYESITTFTVGTIYEKEIAATDGAWWSKVLYGGLAPKVDWLVLTDAGNITAGVAVLVILIGVFVYVSTRDKESQKQRKKVAKR